MLTTACSSSDDAGAGGAGGAGGCFQLRDGSCVEETFANPPVLQPDANGVHTLVLGPTEVVLDGQRHCVRAYNGQFPGPTIETPASESPRSVRVNLINAFVDHDYRDLGGDDSCTCTRAGRESCVPTHVHDPCSTLEAQTCECENADGEVCDHMFDFNTTNLHAHGAHTRPDYARGGEACRRFQDGDVIVGCRECGDDVCDDDISDDDCFHGDDVLSVVHPASGAQYRWDIDEDGTHHEGLSWYHPHIHGTTSIQVASGAAGAWIVRGPLDELPGVADARERVLVLSTPPIVGDGGFQPLADGEPCTEQTITFNNFKTLGAVTAKQLNLVNGLRQPRLVAAPGQVERWRLVHTGYLDEIYLGLFRGNDASCTSWSVEPGDALPLTQIARDALMLPQKFESDYVFMSPGYRVEAILGGEGVLQDGDTWCLAGARALQGTNETPFTDTAVGDLTEPSPTEIRQRLRAGDLIATLNVTASAGAATTTTLPDFDAIAALAPPTTLGGRSAEELCAEAAARPAAQVDQGAVLNVGFWTLDDPDPCDCQGYNVNCKNFELTDRERYPFDRDLPLGQVEHWRLGASVDGHPFHIHINPFLVCPSANPWDPMPFAHWRDTYLVNLDRKIDILTEYKSYTGGFVFHCHKLTHEDDGMMQLVRICDPDTDPSCGSYGWQQCDADDLGCLQARAATE